MARLIPAEIELTEDETLKVEQLRSFITDLLKDGSDLEGASEAKQHSDSTTLLRFVQARPGNVEEAATMFRGAMSWRERVDVEKIWSLRQVSVSEQDPRLQLAERAFYGHVLTGAAGQSLNGEPLMFERLGCVDLAGIVREEGLLDMIEQSYIAYIETAFRAVRVGVGGRKKALVVVDLQGVGLSHLRHVGVIKRMAAIGPPNYPEVTRCVALVRGPWLVSTLWRAVSPLLPEHTRSKVKIMGSDFLTRLRAEIPEEQLPSYLGGECWVGENPDHSAARLLNRSVKVEIGAMGALADKESLE